MPDISDVSSEKISDYNIFIARKIGLGDEYDPTKGEIKYLKTGYGEQPNTPAVKDAWALLTISNESKLTGIEDAHNTQTKVNDAIEIFYKAVLNEIVDSNSTVLSNLYLNTYKDTDVNIIGIDQSIINSDEGISYTNKSLVNEIVKRSRKELNITGTNYN
jgi:hypothetical protein